MVRPTLQYIGLHSAAAENLVVYTGIQESGVRALNQAAHGPATGLWQMEKATHDDLWFAFLPRHSLVLQRITDLRAAWPTGFEQLRGNLNYAAAMCRVLYYRAAPPLPAADDLPGLAAYWKAYYNTSAGAGTAAQFVAAVGAARVAGV